MSSIKTYQDYLKALKESPTEMFWVVPDDVQVLDTFKFDIYFTHDNEYDRKINHVFLNGNYYDGLMLMSKHRPVSEREFNSRFIIEKKEWNLQTSIPKPFDIFYISNYEEYLEAVEKSKTNMFWAVWNDITLDDNFKFDYQVPRYNQHLVHVFKNQDYFDGVCLMPKQKIYSKKEVEFRFFADKKEVDIVASTPKNFDIVFISYNEPDADKNFSNLKSKYPDAKRVHGVKGIHNAHKKAAELSNTKMFWVVDGDAIILDTFELEHQVAMWDQNTVHVWRSLNPINNLEYGYGGVKLLPTDLTLKLDTKTVDMTTSISDKFKLVEFVSNVTAFNTDAYSTWKSAFRECVKLASKVIDRQVDEETKQRLDTWCTQGADKLFGEWAIAGALAGKLFAETHPTETHKINDFDWLYQQFQLQTFR